MKSVFVLLAWLLLPALNALIWMLRCQQRLFREKSFRRVDHN